MPRATNTTATGPAPDVTPEQITTPTGDDAANALLDNLPPDVIDALTKKLVAMLPKTPEPPLKVAATMPADTKAEILKRETAYLKEKVWIELFKDNDKYKDDLVVSVNGEPLRQIQRGKRVQVPRYVAMIIEEQIAQDKATSMLIEQQTKEFQEEAEKHGI